MADLPEIKAHVPPAIDRVARKIRTGADTDFAVTERAPVEVNTDEAGWGPDVPQPAQVNPGRAQVDEYMVDLAAFGSPLDPNSRMEWMRQMQAKIPPPEDNYETISLPAVTTSRQARSVARQTKLRE